MQQSIGFESHLDYAEKQKLESENILHFAEPEDLIRYGFIPELVGRLPIIASADPLAKSDLARILLEPKNALIKQYQALFRQSNVIY